MPAKQTKCCCDETDCTPKLYTNFCYCLPGDFAPEYEVSYATITLSGSGTGFFGAFPSWTGVDWSGTYTVNCNSAANWFAASYCCQNGITLQEVFVIERLTLSHLFDTANSNKQIFSWGIDSWMISLPNGTPNPCPTISTLDCRVGYSTTRTATTSAAWTGTQTYLDWYYKEGARCELTKTVRGCLTTLSNTSPLTHTVFVPGLARVDHTAIGESAVGVVNVPV